MGRWKTVVSAALILSVVGMPATSAAAQDRQQMQDLLRKKYEIEQQKADAETKRAEAAAAAATRRQRGARRSSSNTEPIDIPEGDPLENTDVPICKLASGSSIRISGVFRPSSTTKCQRPESEQIEEIEPVANEQSR